MSNKNQVILDINVEKMEAIYHLHQEKLKRLAEAKLEFIDQLSDMDTKDTVVPNGKE